jgi:Ca2+-binding EF-hand superfamily protein
MNFEEKEESKYRRFIKRLDRDGDNKISIEEFDGPPIHFNEIDQNNDGFIDISESPAGPPERRWIFDMFRNF